MATDSRPPTLPAARPPSPGLHPQPPGSASEPPAAECRFQSAASVLCSTIFHTLLLIVLAITTFSPKALEDLAVIANIVEQPSDKLSEVEDLAPAAAVIETPMETIRPADLTPKARRLDDAPELVVEDPLHEIETDSDLLDPALVQHLLTETPAGASSSSVSDAAGETAVDSKSALRRAKEEQANVDAEHSIVLAWGAGFDDVDLRLTARTQTGFGVIWYGQKGIREIGQLDVDMNAERFSLTPVEHIFLTDQAPPGTYICTVSVFKWRSEQTSLPVIVDYYRRGELIQHAEFLLDRRQHPGASRNRGPLVPQQVAFRFTVEPKTGR